MRLSVLSVSEIPIKHHTLYNKYIYSMICNKFVSVFRLKFYLKKHFSMQTKKVLAFFVLNDHLKEEMVMEQLSC